MYTHTQQYANNSAASTWTNMSDLTDALPKGARTFLASHTPAVYFDTSEKSMANTEAPRTLSTVLTQIASDIQGRGFQDRRT
jgi:hypothetical protein